MQICTNHILLFWRQKQTKTHVYTCAHIQFIIRLITGITVKESFDHKQWDTKHNKVAKLIPMVSNSLYTAVQVTLTINMHFFSLFSRSDVHCGSSVFKLKVEITPPKHRAAFPFSVTAAHDGFSFWADACYSKWTGNNVEGFCNITYRAIKR